MVAKSTGVEHNTRMGQMWSAIAPAVDLVDKRVIDLGCGYGDLAYRAHVAGAAHVLGVDRDLKPVGIQKKKWKGQIRGLTFAEMNIDALVEGNHRFKPPFDMAFCMSVLPYLRSWRDALAWLQLRFPISIIECQYWGDGPGPPELRDDQDLRYALEQLGWAHVDVIGGSVVEDRGAVRTIWRCIND